MIGSSHLVYHTCYTLCILYASRELFKLRNKSWLNDLYGILSLSVDVHPYPHIRIGFTGLPKTCAIFASLIIN